MSKTKPIVHLRVYRSDGRGKGISYDENRKVINENILVKLTHNTLEWANYLKHIKVGGFIKAVVEKVMDGSPEITSKIQKEVDAAMADVEVALTPEQKRIADLEAKLEAFTNGSSNNDAKDSNKSTNDDNQGDELTKARDEYEGLYGKKVFYGWNLDEVKAKIAEKKAE